MASCVTQSEAQVASSSLLASRVLERLRYLTNSCGGRESSIKVCWFLVDAASSSTERAKLTCRFSMLLAGCFRVPDASELRPLCVPTLRLGVWSYPRRSYQVGHSRSCNRK